MDIFLQYNLDLRPETEWNTISATAASKASLLYLQESGDFHCGPGYFTTREGFASFLIKMTVSGCGQLEYQGQQYAIPRNHLFWIDCRKRQHYGTHPATGNWNVLWIHFYGANAQFFYDLFQSNNGGSPVLALPEDSPVPRIMRALLQKDDSSQQRQDLHWANLLHQLISEITLYTIGANRIDDTPQTIQAVRQYLLENYQKKITLEHLGKEFSLSPFYLQKLFKRHIGQTPTEYLIYLRMAKAKELLRTTRMSISEVAKQVGIDNLGYFTRQFKQQEGITPNEYCKLWPTIIVDPGTEM